MAILFSEALIKQVKVAKYCLNLFRFASGHMSVVITRWSSSVKMQGNRSKRKWMLN